MMGPLQKAGGEEVLDILFRLINFPNKKKIYIYGKDRKIGGDKEKKSKSPFKVMNK